MTRANLDRFLGQLKDSILGKAVKPVATIRYSPEDLLEQWVAFASRCQIKSGEETINFIPYDYQIELIKQIIENKSTIVVKTRQLGITEAVSNFFLFKATLNPAYKAVVFSKGGRDTAEISERVQLMASSAGIKLAKQNTEKVEVFGGGVLFFNTSTPDSGRGLASISDILFDEWGFVRTALAIYGAVTPTQKMVGTAARKVVVSTPNGKSGHYWDLLNAGNPRKIQNVCNEVARGDLPPFMSWVGKNGWCKIVCHWKAHPVYSQDENHLDKIRKDDGIDEAQLQRENNLSFEHVLDGGIIDPNWLQVFTKIPIDITRIVQSWDTASTDNVTSAYWACVTLLEDSRGCIYVINCFAKKMTYPTGRPYVASQYLEQKIRPHCVLIENKSTGQNLIQENSSKMLDVVMPVIGINPVKDKIQRLSMEASTIKTGMVYVPDDTEQYPWVDDFKDALASFPYSGKDIADALSQALRWIRLNPARHQASSGVASEGRSIRGLVGGL